MKFFTLSTTLLTGFAMFSMFFGAGNVVFPLALGAFTGDQTWAASLGLLITGIFVPFLGLLSMTLYQGDYHAFFGRLGERRGFIIASLIMALIGPLGALPRTISLSFSTTKMFIPELPTELFSLIAVLVIFLCTFKKNKIVDLIGTILTPILLFSLLLVIIFGLFYGPETVSSNISSSASFLYGMQEGYQTMDLLGALFFSGIIINSLKAGAIHNENFSSKEMYKKALKSSLIGGSLLAAVYSGFSLVSSKYADFLSHLKPDQYLGALALELLGVYGGVVASVAVALACLTTAIALAVVFANFLRNDILQGRISYTVSLFITLVVTYFVSILEFDGIVALLIPPLQILYPALIVLVICNTAHKFWGWKSVKLPVYLTMIAALLYTVYSITMYTQIT